MSRRAPGRVCSVCPVRVLVTGSNGFVGRWLLEHLASCADEVIELDPQLDITEAEPIRAALLAAEPEAVIHLAAQASVGASWGDGGRTFAVNALGAVHLLDAVGACPRPPRVVMVGSSEVYGILAAGDLPVGEDHPLRPASPYAASKAAAEMVGLQAWLGRGLEVVRVRPFNHTGPGQRPDFVVPSLARQVATAAGAGDATLRVGNLAVRRDLTDVRDVVRAYRALVVSGQAGEVYNVCRGSSIGIDEVARRLLELAGADMEIVVDPERFRPADLPDLRGDPTRLHDATGWEPEIPFDTTLGDVLAQWGPDPS